MKKKFLRPVCAFLFFALTVALLLPIRSGLATTLAEDQYRYQQLQSELNRLKKDQQEIASQLAEAKGDLANRQRVVTLLYQEIDAYQEQLDLLSDLILEYTALVSAKKERIAELNESMDRNYALFKERLVFAQESGTMSYIDFILGSHDLSDILSRSEVINETKNTFPVFGMAKNGGSFICIMEGASSYGGILADISMRYNSFNWVCARYTVLHGDQYNVSDKTGSKVYMFEKQIPSDTVRQRYRFVDSGSYADMASAYGDYLRETYPELKNAALDADLPVSVELIGAIDKKVVKFGMPVDSVVSTTTFAQATDIIRELKRGDVKNLSVRVTGWSTGGVNSKVLTSVKVLNELGGNKGMETLINDAKNIGVNLYFDGISCFAYDSGLLEGFIPFRDAARYTTREQVSIVPYSPIIYKADEDQDAFYLVQPKFAQKCTDNLIATLAAKKVYGVAFRDIGNLLSADYYVNDMVTRERVKQMNVDSLKQARAAGEAVMIKEGYDYAMPYADLITDMDLDGVEYSILDTSVPFYQIAIHGAVNYTGKPINLANDWRTDLLRCVEYGAGLNFTFMAESGWVLQDSFYSTYYGASYDAWKENAAEIIAACQTDLKGLNSLRITDHQTVGAGVRLTVYENGTKVYVNYGAEDYQADGVLIPARGYVVEGGERE